MDTERQARAALIGGDVTRAYRLAMLSAAADPASADALWLLGRIALRLGDTDVALKHLCRAGEAGHFAGRTTPGAALRRDMALAVGRYSRQVLSSRPSAPSAGPRLFMCLLFDGDLRLLDLLLEEADDFVDGFVVVEAGETFAGSAKPLCFRENSARYARFDGKIRHVVADPAPRSLDTPCMREFWQRNHVAKGLDGLASDDDYVVIIDSGQVPRRPVLAGIRRDLATLRMRAHAGFLNRLCLAGEPHSGTAPVIARFRYLRATSASELVALAAPRIGGNPDHAIDDGGWHFRMDDEGSADSAGGWITIAADVDAPATVRRNLDRFAELAAPASTQALSDTLERLVQDLQHATRRRRLPPSAPR